MQLTLWVTLAQETTYRLQGDFPVFGILGGKKSVQKCPVFLGKCRWQSVKELVLRNVVLKGLEDRRKLQVEN